MIGMRLHSLILAASCEIPFVPISYDPKINRFVHRLGMKPAIHVDDLSEEGLLQYISECLDHYQHNRRELANAMAELKQQAEKSGEVAVQFLS
jgi:polysaccharide pyruvyl transferase WcaK-like protein